MTSKVCTKCGLKKPLEDFHKRKDVKTGLNSICKLCKNASQRRWFNGSSLESKTRKAALNVAWNKSHPESIQKSQRKAQLRLKFGIAPEQYDEMLEAQGGRCLNPGCRTDKPGGHGKRFHIDHDHVTGKVRGLLCIRCNFLLGHAKDDPFILLGAIEYLGRSGVA